MVRALPVQFRLGFGRNALILLIAVLTAFAPAAQGNVIFEHDFEGIVGDGNFVNTWGPEFTPPLDANGFVGGHTLNPATSGASANWLSPVPAQLDTSFGVLFAGAATTASGLAPLALDTVYTLSFTQFRRDDIAGTDVRVRIFGDLLGADPNFIFAEDTFAAVTTTDTFVDRSISFTTPGPGSFIFQDLVDFGDTIAIDFTGGAGNGGANQVAIDNIRLTAVAVPEPSSAAALFGLGGLVVWRRRRTKK